MKKNLSVKFFALPLILSFGVLCVIFSDTLKQALSAALSMCAETLIPSLFVFLCLSNLALAYSDTTGGIFARAYAFVFHLPANTAAVFFLSLIGGYPVGAMMSARMVEEKRLARDTAQVLPLFCLASGPAFAVVVVGEGLCGSKTIGGILLLSCALSQTLIGIAIGIKNRKKPICKVETIYKQQEPFSAILTRAVENSITAMLQICAYVMLFFVLMAFVRRLPLPRSVQNVLCAMMEVSAGVQFFRHNVPMLAFILGFGGISVLFQIKKYLHITGTKVYMFLLFRLISAALSFGICKSLLCIFPQAVPTLAAGIQVKAVSLSAPFSAALIICFGVFILDKKHAVFSAS